MATARAVRPTRAEWEARAVQLAEAQHLTGTARQLAAVPLREFWAVRKSGPAGEHVIRVEWWFGGELRRITCDCQAGRFDRACKHAGAVLHALRLRAGHQSAGHGPAGELAPRWGVVSIGPE